MPLEVIRDIPYVQMSDLMDYLEQSDPAFAVEWDETFGVLKISRGKNSYSLFQNKSDILANTEILEGSDSLIIHSGRVMVPFSSMRKLDEFWKTGIVSETEKTEDTDKVSVTPTASPATTKDDFPEGSAIFESRKRTAMRLIIDTAVKPVHGIDRLKLPEMAPRQETITRDVALKLKNILEREGSVEVVLTSRSGESPTMDEKIHLINTSLGDALLILRLEASEFSDLSGMEIMVMSSSIDPSSVEYSKRSQDAALPVQLAYLPFEAESARLAGLIHEELNSSVSTKVGNITPAPLYLLKRSAMPSVYVSLGYLSNRENVAALNRDRYRESIARALAASILKFKD